MNNFETLTVARNFQIQVGSCGSGVISQVIAHTDNCIVCRADMTLEDLLIDFRLNDNPEFVPSAFARAMMEGTTITLENFDLLNDDLQFMLINAFESGILAFNSTSPIYECVFNADAIHIAHGFRAVGTITRN